jgi:hypothetical protein
MIVAAHAGTGKTTLASMFPDQVTDLVCMPYKYYLPENGEDTESVKADPDLTMREEWPLNYVSAIKEALEGGKILLIPPAWNVLIRLEMERIPYILCYPRRDAKEVYRQRYITRGNSEAFLSIFIDGWDKFMDTMEADTYGRHIVLEPHEFLGDVLMTSNQAYQKMPKMQRNMYPTNRVLIVEEYKTHTA